MAEQKKKKKEYRGVVTGVLRSRRSGDKRTPFAFVELSDPSRSYLRTATVTFTLVPEVWKEPSDPKLGLEVILANFHKFDTGWRAMAARPVTPEDGEETEV